MEQYIGNTFWANGGAGTGRTIAQTMQEISGMGINMIRLPLVPQTLSTNDPQGTGSVLKNHPSVRIANSRLALETMIQAADAANIEVLLDVHSCSNYVGWRKGRLDARPPWVDATRDNYDFKRENYSCAASGNPSTVTVTHPYNQTLWLQTLRTLAGLGTQLGVDNIIGIDIYNEPWDYTWSDWRSLAAAAYTAINEVNPNTLIFVEGISQSANNQDGTPTTITQVPHGSTATNPNWGENLFEAGANPPAIPKDRLVFSPHTYGPVGVRAEDVHGSGADAVRGARGRCGRRCQVQYRHQSDAAAFGLGRALRLSQGPGLRPRGRRVRWQSRLARGPGQHPRSQPLGLRPGGHRFAVADGLRGLHGLEGHRRLLLVDQPGIRRHRRLVRARL
jgi:hypothetical protein